jgi:hypothetical protein
MIPNRRVIESLRPGVEWTLSGEDITNIVWNVPGTPGLTQAEYDAEENRQTTEHATARAALLTRLGITEDEAALLASSL